MTARSERLWYAVHTRAREEMKAFEHLRQQNFAVYLPRYARKIRHARKTELVTRPFFPRYLFVSLDLSVQGWRSIRSTCGVSDIVCFGERPAALPRGFVESLRSHEDANGCVGVEHRTIRTGDSVVVLEGPFTHLLGVCEAVTENERVTILLDLLGRKVRVVLDGEMVEAA